MNWIIAPLRNYAGFTGRARRIEFWSFFCLFTALQLVARYLDAIQGPRVAVAGGMGIIELIVSLMLLLPFVAVGARRLHDTDRSGWWMLLLYIPYLGGIAARGTPELELVSAGGIVVGAVALFVILALPGTAGPNRHGPDPHGL